MRIHHHVHLYISLMAFLQTLLELAQRKILIEQSFLWIQLVTVFKILILLDKPDTPLREVELGLLYFILEFPLRCWKLRIEIKLVLSMAVDGDAQILKKLFFTLKSQNFYLDFWLLHFFWDIKFRFRGHELLIILKIVEINRKIHVLRKNWCVV